MPFGNQQVDPKRYAIIPRTLSFLLRGNHILLMKLPKDHGTWAGRYNGIGGHIEQGEDPLSSARREIQEETGLSPTRLVLIGVVIIDTLESPGVGLYVFVGEDIEGDPVHGPEGQPEWVALGSLERYPLVEDLPQLIPRALESYASKTPFSAAYRFNPSMALEVHFAP